MVKTKTKSTAPSGASATMWPALIASLCAFIVAASPLGTVWKDAGAATTQEIHWFRYKDQIKLDVEGFTDIRLAIAGGAFLVAQAAFVVLMATAKSPSYFIVDAEDGTLFLKKLDHYVQYERMLWGVVFGVLSFILGLVFIIVGFVALKADTDRGAGINFRPNKMRCLAALGIGVGFALIEAWTIYNKPTTRYFEEHSAGDKLMEPGTEQDELVHSCEAALGVAIVCMGVASSLPYVLWGPDGNTSLRMIASHDIPGGDDQGRRKMFVMMMWPVAVCHFLSLGIASAAVCWVLRCHYKKRRQDVTSWCSIGLAGCACGTEVYAMDTICLRVKAYMPNAGVKYGPSFWLVVGALSIFGCCFFAILYTAFMQKQPPQDGDNEPASVPMAGGGAGGVFGAFAQDAGLVDPHGAQDYYRNQLHQQIAQAQAQQSNPGYYDALRYGSAAGPGQAARPSQPRGLVLR